MSKHYQILEERFQRLAQINHAITFLQWDQLVMMPPGGNQSRAASIAELVTIHHEILSAPSIGEMLDKAEQQKNDNGRLRSIMEMRRAWKQAVCLPVKLVKAKSLAGSKCEHDWRNQRRENDWPGFLENFKEVVQLSREEAQARKDSSHEHFPTPYDALLGLYCTGDSSEFISKTFSQLKEELPVLITQVLEQQPQDIKDLSGSYPEEAQRHLNHKLMEFLGFNFEAGRLDVSMHPFSTGDRGDQRITTRFRANDFLDALLATAHETGHASYESGLPESWHNLPAGNARNMCIHESQSLLFEKQLFLSQPFFSFFTPTLHEILPQTRSHSEDVLWAASTRVQPSYIRVEADEVTYPLHVILRFEIEKELINGNLRAEDIPEVWNEKMQKYLGLSTDGNYTDGCLQDIHWTDGSFGYFPSYTLGALNAAQLFFAIRRHHPDWRENLARGDVRFIRHWLEKNIWSKGSTMDSQDIITEATGEGTNAKHFLNHLRTRYLGKQK